MDRSLTNQNPNPQADEKLQEILLAGLRYALSGEEHLLYRSGKLEGLFPTRNGLFATAVAIAFRDGLLEHTRTEARGKVTWDYARITPAGVDFVYTHDSPRAVLEELREMLHQTGRGVPAWQDRTMTMVEEMAKQITQEMQRYLVQLDTLTKRVEEALKRLEYTAEWKNPGEAGQWSQDALAYLRKRHDAGARTPCPMPELFKALSSTEPDLTIRNFHHGLKRLAILGYVQLLPTAEEENLAEPEYAFIDQGKLLYFIQLGK
ncbi:MAG: hypothetical protein R3B84_02490 [Zavarzinella sp.]